jgi:DNA-directed RNA polymerase subunit RPC12/RpoP
MRTHVEPLPSTHCALCGGELLFKLVKPANHILDLEYEIFVCANCGREQSYIVNHGHNMPHPKVA